VGRYRRRRDRGVPRSRVEAIGTGRQPLRVKHLEAGRVELAAELAEHDATPRPRTRGDCIGAERPCPWVGCRYHLAIEVNPESGSIKIVFPTLELEQLGATCALDVADAGGTTLERVGELTNVTRERVRQLETRSLVRLAAALREQQHEP
jgi:hypothetical protein